MNKKLLIGVIVILAVAIVGSLLFIRMRSADPTETINKTGEVPLGNGYNFSEAPTLAGLVAAGNLPAVENRLPKNPLIRVPLEKIGQYGGTWHLQAKSKADHNSFLRIMGYENLVRWNVNWTDIVPNVAQSFEVNSEATEFTFYLREGLRWSDGEPFTADDIMFWYEDVFSNKELSPTYLSWLVSEGQPVVVQKINDYTVKFVFARPNSQFLSSLAQPKGGEITAYPKHYLKQFLPKYNPNINDLVVAAGVKDAAALFQNKFGLIGTPDEVARWQHPEVPTLNAWVFENRYGDAPMVAAVRNPYYWQIDTIGNQLPYIDRLEFTIEDDANKITELVLQGKIDMQDRHIGNEIFAIISKRKQLEEGAAQGGYHLFKTVISSMNTTIISFNLNHKDPVLRDIFQNKKFRIAMSHAINRQKIVDTIYSGQGKLHQGAPRPESPFYDEVMAKQYTEYDVAKANQYLDEIGLNKKDAEGYRLRPDGKRLAFTIDWGDPKVLALIVADWQIVGVEAIIGNTTDRLAFYAKKDALDCDVAVWKGDGGLEVIQEPRFYFPFSTNESNFALAWGYWFSSPTTPLAQEPPQIVKDQMNLYQELMKTPSQEGQNNLMKKILAIARDQFYVIGISLPVDGFGVVKDNFRNVPETMPSSYVYPNPAPTNPAQYFIE